MGGRQYLLNLAILAHYWDRKDEKSLDWLLNSLRGNLPIGAKKIYYCARCKEPRIELHDVKGVQICTSCILDYINEKHSYLKEERHDD